MDELKKEKLEQIRKWVEDVTSALERPIGPETATDIERFTEYFSNLSEEYKGYHARTTAVARKAREFSPEMENSIRAFEPDLQGIAVVLNELVKFLTFFRQKVSRGMESGKVRAFLQAAGARHKDMKGKGEAVITIINQICPPEKGEEKELA